MSLRSSSIRLAATRARKSEGLISAPQGAAPFRGSPQCAHWGKGSPESDKIRREKTGRSAEHSFPSWQFFSHGDPSVSLTLDSSPKRGAKGVGQDSLAPQGAAPLRGSPQCAHWGKGSPESDKSRREKTGRSADHSFPSWQFFSHGDPSVTFGDSSPKRGAKGGDDKPPPRRALPLLGEGGKRQDAVQTILFPLGSFSAMATPQSPSVTAPLKGEPRA